MKAVACFCVTLGCAILARGDPAPAVRDKSDAPFTKGPKPYFTIGKETTYVTGPVDKLGYIDYCAALNERLKQGVTPANNACVLIWQAIGPHPARATMPAEFFAQLGIEPLPENGVYFIPWPRYLKERLHVDTEKESEKTDNELSRCMEKPWLPREYPRLASWLNANEGPLALAVAATKRSQYFLPIVPGQCVEGPAGLPGALMPSVSVCRDIASALTTRAMLRVGQGDADEAWQDLLACHRLGRLVGRGATIIEGSAAIWIDNTALAGELAFLAGTQPDAKRLERCMSDLRQLPPRLVPADVLDIGDRFRMLDSVMLLDRYGFHYLDELVFPEGLRSKKRKLSVLEWFNEWFWQGVDWDPSLRKMNQWYDRVSAAMRAGNRELREKQLDEVDQELRWLRSEHGRQISSSMLELKRAPVSPVVRGNALGELIFCLSFPAYYRLQRAFDRGVQIENNLFVAYGLARFRLAQGHYPKELSALAPGIIRDIPLDLFSGKPLIYQPAKDGYLLYSVGPNGKDDEGRDAYDEPQGDDISVRMPLPAPRDK